MTCFGPERRTRHDPKELRGQGAHRWGASFTGWTNLDGKVGVITGAASGIGRAMAVAFAGEGMHLALADIEAEPLEETAEMVRADGVNAIVVPTDVSDADAVEHLAQRTVSELGALHLACNNADVSGGGLTWEIDLQTWQWVLG
ncbi:MAG: SDR family NAD(P)-dependent oxidoreductase [Microthrixaceae bacterium]|nr:SDR family NAD(P)-dependent oxidoreductase [Microthrixaceae bacterium]